MKVVRKSSLIILAILTLVITLPALSLAKKTQSSFPNVKIKNFGKMDERFYRGARPKDRDYQALAALRVKTIIDLTNKFQKET